MKFNWRIPARLLLNQDGLNSLMLTESWAWCFAGSQVKQM